MQSNLSPKLEATRCARLHVGIIMDGNGRWATRRGLSRLARPRGRRRSDPPRGRGGAGAGRRHADAVCVLQRQLAPAEDRSLRADGAAAILSRQRGRGAGPQRRSSHRDRTPRPHSRRHRPCHRPRGSGHRRRRCAASAHRDRLLGPRRHPQRRNARGAALSISPARGSPNSSPAKKTCATSTSSSAPAAKSGCRTSCSGKAPTPSCTSPNGCGRNSRRSDLAEALGAFHRRERRFGGLQAIAPEEVPSL